MAYTDEQKTKRHELENKQTPLTPAERFLLAALSDLRDADLSGDNIKGCEESVKQAEKAVAKEKKGTNVLRADTVTLDGEEIVPGGPAVQTLKNTLMGEQG
jgi:hypothetical protein